MKRANEKTVNIKVKLLNDNGVDYLDFTFKDDDVVRLNINDASGQTELKSVFSRMVQLAQNSDVNILPLEVDDTSKGGLLEEVFTEYVQDLNAELGSVRDELRVEQE